MAQTSVAGCVMNIVASFASGQDVLKKLKETRRSRRRAAGHRMASEERRLSRSLRRGPEDIGRQYQQSVQIAGNRFAIGDAIAQTSLAEVLLRLNTGLVGIITSFLSRDKKDLDLNYASLIDLSESSRLETCQTLRRLSQRMLQSRPDADARLSPPGQESLANSKRKRNPPPKQARSHGPTLARVMVHDSSRPSQIAPDRPGERRKRAGSTPITPTKRSAASTSLSLPPPPYDPLADNTTRPMTQRPQTVPLVARARRKQSTGTMQVVTPPSEPHVLRATRSTPRLQRATVTEAEPLPALGRRPSAALLDMTRQRKETPTYYSIDSGSTKLGEIPLHRWAQPFDFDAMSLVNREARENGWPGSDEGLVVKKRRRGLLGLFKRKKEAVA
ncbi:hypothetical protein Tdes44962_MAKER03522 [Teratosphaeria destructans]|uniref:Uncharacterized protein n=1 Tax=Teratosphaeria destructans TaxID=418781 RepID=A0A9W7W1I8_9PEZI|nr:hypothetical protein Tdes44962_MAKER03522 [Teratosphaeria destructans]